jgi:Protein of unknown function (DUF1573)
VGHDHLRYPQPTRHAQVLSLRRRRARLFVALLTLASSSNCHKPAPKPRAGNGGPRLTLSETRYDFGSALTHDQLRHTFQVHNAGGAPLVIDDIVVGHECAVATSSLTLSANASAALEVSCRPNQYGAFLSTVSLRSNEPNAAPLVLELRADVSPLLAWKQPVLALELKFGEDRREQVELFGARTRTARLSLSSTANTGLELAILHEAGGDKLAVHALGRAVGTRIGEIKVATGLDDPAELGLPFSFTVVGTLVVDPSNPYFDLLRAGGRRVELRVASAQPGFRVLGADVLDGPFQASFLGSPGGTYRVAVTFLPERVQGEQRGTLGHLRVRSNDRSEPTKELTLMAFGRAQP